MALTTPATWVAGAVVTATQLNTEDRDQFNALLAAPTAYTPTWTSSGSAPALGNGTLVGEYYAIGDKFVDFTITLTLGSTSTVGTGNYLLTLPPFTPAAGRKAFPGTFFDNSAGAIYPIFAVPNASTTLNLYQIASPVTTFTAALPVVPATSDIYHIAGRYRTI